MSTKGGIVGPNIKKEITERPNGDKAKISVDISDQIFKNLEDYNRFFDGMNISHEIVGEHIPKSKTREMILAEISQLILFMKESNHYKKLTTIQTNREIPAGHTYSAEDRIQEAEKIITQKNHTISKEELQLLDKYYKNILEGQLDTLEKAKMHIDDQTKNMRILKGRRNLVNRLFDASKKDIQEAQLEEEDTSTKEESTLQKVLGSIFSQGRRIKSKMESKLEKTKYKQTIAVIEIITANSEAKYVACEFVDSGKKLRGIMDGSIEFSRLTADYKPEDGVIISISHPGYIDKKLS